MYIIGGSLEVRKFRSQTSDRWKSGEESQKREDQKGRKDKNCQDKTIFGSSHFEKNARR